VEIDEKKKELDFRDGYPPNGEYKFMLKLTDAQLKTNYY